MSPTKIILELPFSKFLLKTQKLCLRTFLQTPDMAISPSHPSLHLSHPTPDSLVWNTIIRAAASAYPRMRRHRVPADTYTFPFLLSAHAPHLLLPALRAIHAHALLLGLLSHPFTLTALLSAYSASDTLPDALRLFAASPRPPDLPSWNSLLAAHLRLAPLPAARHLFDAMPHRNVVTWTCMIDGLAKRGDHLAALDLFRNMLTQRNPAPRVRPNRFTLSSVLSACAGSGALEQGQWVHRYIERHGVAVDTVLATALIDMYCKCGSIGRARQVFEETVAHNAIDVAAWTAMMSGLALHGLAAECLVLFERMRGAGLTPNAGTFLVLLSACVHAGMVDEGKKYFKMMKEEYGMDPTIEHYGCVVDLFARAGRIGEAWDAVKRMPMKPDALIWGALLSGSKTHGDVAACEAAAKQLVDLEPTNSAAYLLLANVYAKMRMWDDVRRVRDRMEELGMKKTPGCTRVLGGRFIARGDQGNDCAHR